MAAHQFRERRFGATLNVSSQKLWVGLIVHSPHSSRCRPNRTGNVALGILPDVEGGCSLLRIMGTIQFCDTT
jgi:hypothetical protein